MSCAGDEPSLRAALRNARSASGKDSLLAVVFLTRYLMFLTADSARPLLLGLYGLLSSLRMLLLLQKEMKWEQLNCGPPSERIDWGFPQSKNHDIRGCL